MMESPMALRRQRIEAFEHWWVEQLRERVARNLNCVILFTGPSGSGKSYAALRTAELLDPAFDIDRVFFSADKFIERVNDESLGPGSCLVWDESGLDMDARRWQSITNRVSGYVLETWRYRRLVLMMTIPFSDMLDRRAKSLATWYIEMTGEIDRVIRASESKPFVVTTSPRFSDEPYLKYPVLGRDWRPNGPDRVERILFLLPTESLRDKYERRRAKYMSDFYNRLHAELIAARAVPLAHVPCLNCGKPIPPGSGRRYCNSTCRSQASRSRQAARGAAAGLAPTPTKESA